MLHGDLTVADVATDFWRYIATVRRSSEQGVAQILSGHIIPRLGPRRLAELRPRDATTLVQEVMAREGDDRALQVVDTFQMFLTYAGVLLTCERCGSGTFVTAQNRTACGRCGTPVDHPAP